MRSLVILFISILPLLADCKRLRDRIYVPVQAASFCFRRTNGTHQFGCTSDVAGNVGVVHVVRSASDLDWILEEGPHDPYVAAFMPRMFTRDNLVRFRDSKKAAGAILLNPIKDDEDEEEEDFPLPDFYSDDSGCPNSASDLYRGTADECRADQGPREQGGPKWNPGGSGNLFESFPFPIFVSKDNETSSFILDDCYETFNKPHDLKTPRDWPLCAMELKAHMYSAVDTETCLRRSNIVNIVNPTKFCDEMGDQNTFLFLKERNSSETNEDEEDVIVVATRIDTVNMFDGSEFGSDSPVTNIVAALEAARILAKAVSTENGHLNSNVLFAFFHGEAFDYIGSSRLAYDLQEGKFPNALDAEKWTGGQQPVVNLTQIKMVVELGQLFNVHSGGRVFLHTDGKSRVDPGLISALTSAAQKNKLNSAKASRDVLPPSSLQSLLKVRRDLPGIYISDHDASYTNRYYHSIYDTASGNLGYNHSHGQDQTIVEHISKVAMTLAQFVYSQSTSGRRSPFPSDLTSNKTLVNELLHCYLDTARCPLFLAASNEHVPMAQADFPWPQYVGVDYSYTKHGIFTRNLLAYLTGEKVADWTEDKLAKDCVAPADQNVYEHIFLKGESVPPWWSSSERPPCNESVDCGYCYRTLTFRRDAVSPAYVIKDYDLKDSRYGAWAESAWKTSGARVFLKASPALQQGHFAAGVVVIVLSFLVVFWMNKYSAVIFSGNEDDAAVVVGSRESTSTAETRVDHPTM